MKLLLCLASFISLAFASDVLYYSNKDFSENMPSHDLALVEFFAPWCADCTMLDPFYEEAARILKDNDPPVPLIKVDCTVDTGTCVQYGAQYYPTFKVMRNGEAEDYKGRVTAADLVKNMKYMAGPASKELKTVEDVEKFLAHDDYSVIGFFRNNNSDLAKIYRKVADPVKMEILFAHTTEQAIKDKYNYNNDIVLFQPKIYQNVYEEPIRKYDGEASTQKITEWIQKQSLGLCSERTNENSKRFKRPLFVVYYDVNFFRNKETTIYWRNRVLEVAKRFHDAGKDVNFAISHHKTFEPELDTFGLTEERDRKPVFVPRDKPVVTARDTRERKYVMPDEFSEENLEKFVNDVLEDRIEQYLLSDPIPLSNDEPVKVAVARNFDEIVNREDKDVLIEFYAPWCNYCTEFEPKYKELAEKLKDEPDLIIAKMDATTNELPDQYEYSEFPIIYFAGKGNKNNPKLYNGDRKVDAVMKFIAKESTNELKGYTRRGSMRKTEL
ncbi:hypothetical protein ACJMK2_042877 [Sinanodonta woodiana]|uniref:protein disulfide-isomerase n=1 Tax=Sinanodonta woodiana TaxID=1069815 RepID=A0ABD3VYE4_SINWO